MITAVGSKKVGGRMWMTALVFITAIGADVFAQSRIPNINELQKKGDIYYNKATNTPYTGEVNPCDCEECGCGAEMKNGKFHGKYTVGDGEGGYTVGNFKDGKKDGEWTDYDYGELQNVEIYKDGVLQPNNGTFIGHGTLNCSNQTSITIPNGAIYIGSSAFYACESLTSVIIPKSVTHISNSAFPYSDKFNEINVAADNPKYSSLDGILYNKARDTLIRVPIGKTVIAMPNSVTNIRYGALVGCNYLTSITLSNRITSLKSDIFSSDDGYGGWVGLTSITIPNSVKSIEEGLFSGCERLTSISLPNSLTAISNQMFMNCKSLTSITIPNSVTSIGESAFYGCTSLTSITIPGSVKSIGANAFYGCTGLTSITIPNSVTSIGENAFSGCINLTSIPISNAVKSIKNGEFKGFKNLTSITIPNSVTSIGEDAFSGCINLTSITLPNSLTSIGKGAFSGCKNLVSVTIPNSVVSLGSDGEATSSSIKKAFGVESGVFSGCSGLKTVTIGSKVTSIGDYTFANCKSLTSITVPNSVTSIGASAFSGCDSLASVTVGAGVTSIVRQAFKDLKNLTSITLGNGVTTIGEEAFLNCKSLVSITIPNSVTSIGKSAFSGCRKLETINIASNHPRYIFADGILYNKSRDTLMLYTGKNDTTINIVGSVTTIGEGAFSSSTALKSITIPSSVTSIGNMVFNGCLNITVKNSKPPSITAYTFPLMNAAACTLYVPQGSAYASTQGWNRFKHIGYMDPTGRVLQVVSANGAHFAADQQAAQMQNTIDQYKKQLAECEAKRGGEQCDSLMYMLGYTYYQLAGVHTAGGSKTDYSMATQTIQRLLEKYPASRYAASANQMLTSIEHMKQQAEQMKQQAAQVQNNIDPETQLAECDAKKGDCSVLLVQLGTACFTQQIQTKGAGGDYSIAKQMFQRLLNEYPASPYVASAKQMLAQIEHMMGRADQMTQQAAQIQNNIDQYKKQLAECEAKKRDCSVLLVQLGAAYYSQQIQLNEITLGAGGDYSIAIQMFQRLLNEYPASPYVTQAKQMLAKIEALTKTTADVAQNNPQENETALSKTLESNAAFNEEVLFKIIEDGNTALLNNKNYDAAIENFTEAIRMNQATIDAALSGKVYERCYLNRGSAYMMKKDYDKALADFNEAIRLNPNSREADILRNMVYEEINKANGGLERTQTNSDARYANWQLFTPGQRFGTWGLNWFIPGIGSLAIMKDWGGAITQWVLLGGGIALMANGYDEVKEYYTNTYRYYDSRTGTYRTRTDTLSTYYTNEPNSLLYIGVGCLVGNFVFNIVRSITYDKKIPKNTAYLETPSLNLAVLPDRDGNIKGYMVYNMEF